ncbi:MAG: histidine phosphatase family protein [Rhodospirillales bacterium]
MTALLLLRHGPTHWNAAKRVQGRGDLPLSEAGRREVMGWRVPAEFAGFAWITSPLSRAVETARLLGAGDAARDDRLVEMDWGEWEGRHLDDLRRELGDLMRAWEARGLDFCAPGGETPRQVQRRLLPFLAERAAARENAVAVAHKGIIRAVYALATGWDMTGPPRHKLREPSAHLFDLARDGAPSLARLNIALRPESGA